MTGSDEDTNRIQASQPRNKYYYSTLTQLCNHIVSLSIQCKSEEQLYGFIAKGIDALQQDRHLMDQTLEEAAKIHYNSFGLHKRSDDFCQSKEPLSQIMTHASDTESDDPQPTLFPHLPVPPGGLAKPPDTVPQLPKESYSRPHMRSIASDQKERGRIAIDVDSVEMMATTKQNVMLRGAYVS
jgi:hypothetical protein